MQIACSHCQKIQDIQSDAGGDVATCFYCQQQFQTPVLEWDEFPDFGFAPPSQRRRRFSISMGTAFITALVAIVWGTWPQITKLKYDSPIAIGLMAFVYLLPSLLAILRVHRSSRSIVAVNLLLGWTVVGWIAALAVALRRPRKTRYVTYIIFPEPDIIVPVVVTSVSNAPRMRPPPLNIGWIYLLQSGEYYKIGRTKNLDSRIRQLKIQLPFPVEQVHMIKTNNPVRAEQLWHERFASKRMNGEWFRLNANDLGEFKQHKFQIFNGIEILVG